MSHVCPRCSSPLPANATFCPSCGTQVASPAPARPASPQAGARPRVRLRMVRADGGPESVIPMNQDVLTCGKQGDLPITDDPFVASEQVRLYFSGARLVVDDVGGGNGVFTRLRQERELPVGSELRVGRQRLVVEPVPPAVPGPGGVLSWGSPDDGARFRLIQVLEGGLRGNAYPLGEGDSMLGREHGEVTFPQDGFVSSRHAAFQFREGRLFVKDLGSSNGTFLRLAGPTFVESGDQYLIGRHLLRVELS